MCYEISTMDWKTAVEVVNWHYEAPYEAYNIDGDLEEADAMLDGYHFVARDQELGLVGFFCYGINAQVPGGRARGYYGGWRIIDIGLGLRPDLTGQGLGQKFVESGLKFAQRRWKLRALRLTVANDNCRAIKIYERLGFTVVDKITAIASHGLQEYLIMLLPAAKFDKIKSKTGKLK